MRKCVSRLNLSQFFIEPLNDPAKFLIVSETEENLQMAAIERIQEAAGSSSLNLKAASASRIQNKTYQFSSVFTRESSEFSPSRVDFASAMK